MSAASRLRDLVSLLTDSQKGYATAAELAPDLKNDMMQAGNERAPMIEELGYALAGLGEETPGEGTARGSMHRAWLEVLEKLSPSDDRKIIAECRRGEEHLLERYVAIIDSEEITHQLKPMLEGHVRSIRSRLESLREMENIRDAHEQE